MTELLIAYPDIPASANKIDTREDWGGSGNNATLFELENNIRSERWHRAELHTAKSSPVDIVYQGQSSMAADYLLIALGNEMALGSGATITLSESTDGSSYTQVFSDTVGDLPANWIRRFTSASDVFWRVRFAWSSGSRTLRHSKIYVGTLLDLECDADAWPSESEGLDFASTKGDSGARGVWDLEDKGRKWVVQWNGISDAKLRELQEKVISRRHRERFFLVTDTNHDILDDRRIVHVKCTGARQTIDAPTDDWNAVELTFEELIG